MADLFRVLMRDNRELAPLADEVELCRQYLELEKLRLGDRLQVEWHVNSMPGDALVPPLVLQPLLENAVYHGIEPSSDARRRCRSTSSCQRGEVHAILRNPYRPNGGRHHAGNKMALGNVRERLALHFDAEASLESRVVERRVRSAYPDALPHRSRRSRRRSRPRRRDASRNAPRQRHAARKRRRAAASARNREAAHG